MKVVLYMAMTLNGYIAKEDDDTGFVSKEEWDSYSRAVRKAGNLVVGHRTYDILVKQPEFVELKKVRIVVISKKPFKTLDSNHLTAKSPDEALKLLGESGTVIVAGGGILNASFMEENLIDEIYIDIEPVVFGNGIKLFADSEFETKLNLIGVKSLSKDVIQLHYKVKKS